MVLTVGRITAVNKIIKKINTTVKDTCISSIAAPNTPIDATPILRKATVPPTTTYHHGRRCKRVPMWSALALVRSLILAHGAAMQSPHHDQRSNRQTYDVEEKHRQSQTVCAYAACLPSKQNSVRSIRSLERDTSPQTLSHANIANVSRSTCLAKSDTKALRRMRISFDAA